MFVGWEGVNCESDIDECNDTSTCVNGKCINNDGGFTCDCTGTGYDGMYLLLQNTSESLKDICNAVYQWLGTFKPHIS